MSEELKVFKYNIILKCLGTDVKVMYLENKIRDLTVFKLWKDNIMPVVQLDLTLARNELDKIQDYAEDVRFVLTVERFIADNENESTNDLDIKRDGYLLKDLELIPYNINRTPLYNDSKLGNEDEDNAGGEKNNFNMVFNCLIGSIVNKNKKISSNVYSGVNVKSAIVHHMSINNISNVLMDPVDNNTSYPEMIVPPYNFFNFLRYQQEVFGIYNTGFRLFLDYDYTYLLSNDLKKPPSLPPNPEYNKIIFEMMDPSDSETKKSSGYVINNDTRTATVRSINITEFDNKEMSIREKMGESIQFLSRSFVNNKYSGDFGIDNISQYGTNSSINKDVVKWNNYDNKFIETQL